ncbi:MULTISPECIES: FecR domain-containing protein [unclassified Sphingomonas]|uniref:FecR family protein n=1 Tax=unclassified Sphingomonas TaxID=196159 RepID=UPI0025D5C689|nr:MULTISPECIES: FecR domain-containing protein [unclassified Sphingomonas]
MTETNDEGAAYWASRLDDGALDAAATDALQAWLDADPRRCGTLLRAQAGLSRVQRLRAAGVAAPIPATGRMVAALRRHAGRMMLVAAALVAVVASGLALWPSDQHLVTALGEVRRVPLSDGSVVAINTASSLHVAMEAAQRRIVLDRGEAWFQVAHDRSRPFVVAVGAIEVEAVGTAFSVRRRDDGIDLLVTQGVVEVRRGGAGPALRVRAGEKMVVPTAGVPAPPVAMPAAVERDLAWRKGELALEGQTLGDAANEINRYNRIQIAVDPAVASAPLIGYFRTDDPVAFARSAAAVAQADMIQDGETIRITVRRQFRDSSK